MAWACMAACKTGPLVFIEDETTDRSSRMNSDVYRAVLSADRKVFTVQMNDDPQRTAKET